MVLKDKMHEECGVIGIYSHDRDSIAEKIYYGLTALQHRGQESAGIAVCNEKEIQCYKKMGLVQDALNEELLNSLKGKIAIGHVRYSTTGESSIINAQPINVTYSGGSLAVAHNGNLTNTDNLKAKLQGEGIVFTATTDSEVIANLIARNYSKGNKNAIIDSFNEMRGSFSIVLIFDGKLIGAKDPYGIRPLCVGRLESSYIIASETCALDALGAEYIREVKNGEIIIIDENGIESLIYNSPNRRAMCSFEYVYFARPDSNIENRNVYLTRIKAGKMLALESPVKADMIIAVPDSGVGAAIGYAEESLIPYGSGLVKNEYAGRTFIEPTQTQREHAVRLKLNVLKDNVKNKQICLIDDSIVRGTTCKTVINALREAGAKEIHVRIGSPPVRHSCCFGIDTPDENELLSALNNTDEICKIIGADSLSFLSLEGLLKCLKMRENELCTGCFDGNYPGGKG